MLANEVKRRDTWENSLVGTALNVDSRVGAKRGGITAVGHNRRVNADKVKVARNLTENISRRRIRNCGIVD